MKSRQLKISVKAIRSMVPDGFFIENTATATGFY